MLVVLNIFQLITYIALLALLGQGLLYVLAGQKRAGNFVYQLFQILNRPWFMLAKAISFKQVNPDHYGWIAFFVISIIYFVVTMLKIDYCVSIQMADLSCRQ